MSQTITADKPRRIKPTTLAAIGFAAPLIIYMLIFYVWPLIQNISMSMHRYTRRTFVTGDAPWSGFDIYKEILSNQQFWTILGQTLIFVFASIVFQYSIGLALAVFFNQNFKLSAALRGAFLVPWLLPPMISGTIWQWMMDADSGVINNLIETFTINENAYINLSIGMCADMFAYPRTPTGQEEHVAHLIWLYERLRTNDQFQNTDVDVYKLFLKELKNFESDFQEYLATAVNENIPYRERADQLFKEITEAQTPIQEESFAIGSVENYASFSSGRDDHYVLSFNFTRPLTNSPTFANIHGSLQDKNAFFGIGGTSQYTEDDDLPNAVRFTKAERSLSLGVTGTNTDLDSVFRALQSPEENLRVIKFFGLSLGEADYPYLKQFFDKSHITDTDSGVNSFLGFYYTKGQARDELVHSINSLLQRYSSDTGHKPIGGLMRELQNTGRLTIEELQVACD